MAANAPVKVVGNVPIWSNSESGCGNERNKAKVNVPAVMIVVVVDRATVVKFAAR